MLPVSRRKYGRTTVRNERARPAPDLVDWDFEVDEPNELWVADITYVPTATSFVYLAVVLDAYSRRIVRWSMANHLGSELVVDALEIALDWREPDHVIHHSDQGCQYTSIAFGHRCQAAGVRPSMGSVGDSYDNALSETIKGLYKAELIYREGPWQGLSAVELATFHWVTGTITSASTRNSAMFPLPNSKRIGIVVKPSQKRLLDATKTVSGKAGAIQNVHENVTRDQRCETIEQLLSEVYGYVKNFVEHGSRRAGHQKAA